MNQSSVIGAALVIAYVIFVITRGELPCFMNVLGIATNANCPKNLQPSACAGASSTPTTTTTSSTSGGSGSVGVGGLCITLGSIHIGGGCTKTGTGTGGGGTVGINLPPIGGIPGIGVGVG